MLKKNYKEVEEKQAILSDGTAVKDVSIRWLIDKNLGAKNFAMRRFEIKTGQKVPLHNHPQEHEIYILAGKGKFYNDKNEIEIAESGDFLFIPPNEKHGIENLGKVNLIFLCLIPYLDDKT
ncbi:MAG: cupin domain-containing protein [Candidatus Hodarchaeota archaeon]